MNTIAKQADQVLITALQTQLDQVPAVRIDSPPGAGKTGVIERLAAQSLGRLHERCAIATPTNEQSYDLARRLSRGFTKLRFYLFVTKDAELPSDLEQLTNLTIARETKELPIGECVVIANAAKWAYATLGARVFDVLIVDEAFQLPDYRFQLIAGIAKRFVLVGDPGQIAPVISCSIERWKTDPAGPHQACPIALAVRYPDLVRLELPISRRLPTDTVSVIQPAFYPTLKFASLALAGERKLQTTIEGTTEVDQVLNQLYSGKSLVMAKLPNKTVGQVDHELAQYIVDSIRQLIKRQTVVIDGTKKETLSSRMIGVVCAHVSQVNAIREKLGAEESEILVETAERFQGLERSVMFVYHPLSGSAGANAFHLDVGRLCVMTTRHRVGCVVVARANVGELLAQLDLPNERFPGQECDKVYEGYCAHKKFLTAFSDSSTGSLEPLSGAP